MKIHKPDKFIRLFAWPLMVVFLFQNTALSSPAYHMSTGKNQIQVQPSNNIFIPEQYGRIENQIRNPSQPLVVLIKDAHCNYEAQRNIAKILDILVKDYKIDLVCVEGASGKVDPSNIANFPDADNRENVAAKYLKQGYLTGSEVLAIENGKDYGFNIFGVEDIKLYLSNLQAFRDVYGDSEIADSFIKIAVNLILDLKEKLFTENLLNFDKTIQNYRQNKISLVELIGCLSKHKAEAKNIKLIKKVIRLEEIIDYNKVEKERKELIEEIEKACPKEEIQQLVQNSLLYRLGKLSSLDYYAYLKQFIPPNKTEQFSNLYKYIRSLKLHSRIDEEDLFTEIDLLIESVYTSYMKDEISSKLHEIDEKIYLLSKLLRLEITRDEFNKYKESSLVIKDIVEFLKIQGVINNITVPHEFSDTNFLNEIQKICGYPDAFYKYAFNRDGAIINNLISRMKDENKDKAVLILGGFHADGAEKLMQEKNIQVVTITPSITKEDIEARKIYISRMMDEAIQPDKIFTELGINNLAATDVFDPLFRGKYKSVIDKMEGDLRKVVNGALEGSRTEKEFIDRIRVMKEGLEQRTSKTDAERMGIIVLQDILTVALKGTAAASFGLPAGGRHTQNTGEPPLALIKKKGGYFYKTFTGPVKEEGIYRVLPLAVGLGAIYLMPALVTVIFSFLIFNIASVIFIARHELGKRGPAIEVTLYNHFIVTVLALVFSLLGGPSILFYSIGFIMASVGFVLVHRRVNIHKLSKNDESRLPAPTRQTLEKKDADLAILGNKKYIMIKGARIDSRIIEQMGRDFIEGIVDKIISGTTLEAENILQMHEAGNSDKAIIGILANLQKAGFSCNITSEGEDLLRQKGISKDVIKQAKKKAKKGLVIELAVQSDRLTEGEDNVIKINQYVFDLLNELGSVEERQDFLIRVLKYELYLRIIGEADMDFLDSILESILLVCRTSPIHRQYLLDIKNYFENKIAATENFIDESLGEIREEEKQAWGLYKSGKKDKCRELRNGINVRYAEVKKKIRDLMRLYNMYYGAIVENGMEDNRHDFMIAVPTMDRPDHLENLLESLLEELEDFGYYKNRRIHVVVMDDSRAKVEDTVTHEKKVIAEEANRDIVARYSAEEVLGKDGGRRKMLGAYGVTIEYYDARRQIDLLMKLKREQGIDFGFFVNKDLDTVSVSDFGGKGYSGARNMVKIISAEEIGANFTDIDNLIVVNVDDDIRFANPIREPRNVKSPTLDHIFNYFGRISKAFHAYKHNTGNPLDIASGLYTGRSGSILYMGEVDRIMSYKPSPLKVESADNMVGGNYFCSGRFTLESVPFIPIRIRGEDKLYADLAGAKIVEAVQVYHDQALSGRDIDIDLYRDIEAYLFISIIFDAIKEVEKKNFGANPLGECGWGNWRLLIERLRETFPDLSPESMESNPKYMLCKENLLRLIRLMYMEIKDQPTKERFKEQAGRFGVEMEEKQEEQEDGNLKTVVIAQFKKVDVDEIILPKVLSYLREILNTDGMHGVWRQWIDLMRAQREQDSRGHDGLPNDAYTEPIRKAMESGRFVALALGYDGESVVHTGIVKDIYDEDGNRIPLRQGGQKEVSPEEQNTGQDIDITYEDMSQFLEVLDEVYSEIAKEYPVFTKEKLKEYRFIFIKGIKPHYGVGRPQIYLNPELLKRHNKTKLEDVLIHEFSEREGIIDGLSDKLKGELEETYYAPEKRSVELKNTITILARKKHKELKRRENFAGIVRQYIADGTLDGVWSIYELWAMSKRLHIDPEIFLDTLSKAVARSKTECSVTTAVRPITISFVTPIGLMQKRRLGKGIGINNIYRRMFSYLAMHSQEVEAQVLLQTLLEHELMYILGGKAAGVEETLTRRDARRIVELSIQNNIKPGDVFKILEIFGTAVKLAYMIESNKADETALGAITQSELYKKLVGILRWHIHLGENKMTNPQDVLAECNALIGDMENSSLKVLAEHALYPDSGNADYQIFSDAYSEAYRNELIEKVKFLNTFLDKDPNLEILQDGKKWAEFVRALDYLGDILMECSKSDEDVIKYIQKRLIIWLYRCSSKSKGEEDDFYKTYTVIKRKIAQASIQIASSEKDITDGIRKLKRLMALWDKISPKNLRSVLGSLQPSSDFFVSEQTMCNDEDAYKIDMTQIDEVVRHYVQKNWYLHGEDNFLVPIIKERLEGIMGKRGTSGRPAIVEFIEDWLKLNKIPGKVESVMVSGSYMFAPGPVISDIDLHVYVSGTDINKRFGDVPISHPWALKIFPDNRCIHQMDIRVASISTVREGKKLGLGESELGPTAAEVTEYGSSICIYGKDYFMKKPNNHNLLAKIRSLLKDAREFLERADSTDPGNEGLKEYYLLKVVKRLSEAALIFSQLGLNKYFTGDFLWESLNRNKHIETYKRMSTDEVIGNYDKIRNIIVDMQRQMDQLLRHAKFHFRQENLTDPMIELMDAALKRPCEQLMYEELAELLGIDINVLKGLIWKDNTELIQRLIALLKGDSEELDVVLDKAGLVAGVFSRVKGIEKLGAGAQKVQEAVILYLVIKQLENNKKPTFITELEEELGKVAKAKKISIDDNMIKALVNDLYKINGFYFEGEEQKMSPYFELMLDGLRDMFELEEGTEGSAKLDVLLDKLKRYHYAKALAMRKFKVQNAEEITTKKEIYESVIDYIKRKDHSRDGLGDLVEIIARYMVSSDEILNWFKDDSRESAVKNGLDQIMQRKELDRIDYSRKPGESQDLREDKGVIDNIGKLIGDDLFYLNGYGNGCRAVFVDGEIDRLNEESLGIEGLRGFMGKIGRMYLCLKDRDKARKLLRALYSYSQAEKAFRERLKGMDFEWQEHIPLVADSKLLVGDKVRPNGDGSYTIEPLGEGAIWLLKMAKDDLSILYETEDEKEAVRLWLKEHGIEDVKFISKEEYPKGDNKLVCMLSDRTADGLGDIPLSHTVVKGQVGESDMMLMSHMAVILGQIKNALDMKKDMQRLFLEYYNANSLDEMDEKVRRSVMAVLEAIERGGRLVLELPPITPFMKAFLGKLKKEQDGQEIVASAA